jgi:hypothetical protein
MLAKHHGPVVYTLLVLAGGIACILSRAPVWATAVTAVAMMLIADQLEQALIGQRVRRARTGRQKVHR